jgi:RNA polymerase sigma-70 factor (ECF subfamily)
MATSAAHAVATVEARPRVRRGYDDASSGRVHTLLAVHPHPDGRRESREWLTALRGDGAVRDDAVARLHALLMRAARFEVARRRPELRSTAGAVDEIASQAASDALVAVLAKLDQFRGESRFTTWAYKFALLEAAVKVRRQSWRGHEVTLDDAHQSQLLDRSLDVAASAEAGELLGAVAGAIRDQLTPHQRRVLVAITLDGVPIDVLAERLGTTRGALYKTLHDARRKLRECLREQGLEVVDDG